MRSRRQFAVGRSGGHALADFITTPRKDPPVTYRAFIASIALAACAAPALASSALAQKHNCLACHTADKKLVGPAYQEVAKKYAGQKDAEAKLTESIRKGSQGKWGPVAMPPNATPTEDEAKALAKWILGGAK
jgi:cytochrome c